jgi:hypothetical protein
MKEKGEMHLGKMKNALWEKEKFVLTNFKNSMRFLLTFPTRMNQPNESGFLIDNQKIMHSLIRYQHKASQQKGTL